MRGACRVACLVLVAASPAYAEPPKVPAAPVVVSVGSRPAVVTVEGLKPGEFGCAPAFAPEDCLLFPGETDAGGRKVYLVQPYKAGVYRVVFWAKGETAFSTLVIDASGNPQPQPPGPNPPQPPPTDPLVKVLKDAWATETAADRQEKVAKLAQAMRDAAKYAADPAHKTNAELAAAVGRRSAELVPAGQLPAVRKAITAHLQATFPATVFALDDTWRAKFAAEYARIAAALGGLE